MKVKAVASDNNPGIRLLTVNVAESDAINKLTETLKKHMPRDRKVTFLCIGTDRSTGDSFGPMLGTFLEQKGIDVVGTLKLPAHATNLDDRIAEIPKENFVVAIDACLGKLENVGNMNIIKGKMFPGAGVDKKLTPVGDLAISYVVNAAGFMEYAVLQNTRLSAIWDGAQLLSSAIGQAVGKESNSIVSKEQTA